MIGDIIGRGRVGEVYAFGSDKALKLFYDTAEITHIEHEYRVSQLIQQEQLPIARVYDVIDWHDRKGIVYDLIHGETFLHVLFSHPEKTEWIAATSAELLYRIHLRHNNELPSQRASLIGMIEAAHIPEQWKEQTLQLLSELPDGSHICHGDFHPDNIIFSPKGPVIIDWSSATCGNPYADYAQSVLLLRIATTPDLAHTEPTNRIRKQFLHVFQKTYESLSLRNTEELERWIIPVAVARLAQNIMEEKDQLIAIITAGLEDYKVSKKFENNH